jgi:hypothetical protein
MLLNSFWCLVTECLQPQFCKMTQITLSVHWQPCQDLCFVLLEPTTMIANQCGPQQHQSPLGRVPLVTANKDADFQCANQSELLFSWDSSSGAHTATMSLLAPTPSAGSASGHWDPLWSPPPALTAPRPARIHPAADARKTGIASTNQSLWP